MDAVYNNGIHHFFMTSGFSNPFIVVSIPITLIVFLGSVFVFLIIKVAKNGLKAFFAFFIIAGTLLAKTFLLENNRRKAHCF